MLSPLVTAAKQQDHLIPGLGVIDSIAGPDIDLELENLRADPLMDPGISMRQTVDPH